MQLTMNEAYYYARGYYDGRAKGVRSEDRTGTSTEQLAYKIGYDCGVTDYDGSDEEE